MSSAQHWMVKPRICSRKPGLRPRVEPEPTEHPLAVEQPDGIGLERIGAVYHAFEAQQAATNRASAKGSGRGSGPVPMTGKAGRAPGPSRAPKRR